MSPWMLARRFVERRAVSSLLAVLSVASAVAIIASLQTLPGTISRGGLEPALRAPVVVARAESPSRAVLGAVFLEQPELPRLSRIALERTRAYETVAETVPVGIRHGSGGPIVSTTKAYFRLGQGQLQLASGRFFDEDEREVAVLGHDAARVLNVETGASVAPADRGRPLRVVGRLSPTGTQVDRTIFTPQDPDADDGLNAIIVVPRPGFDPQALAARIDLVGVVVVEVEATLRRLVSLVAAVDRIVSWLAAAIGLLAAALLLANLHSSMRERVRDLAILRVVGAGRWSVSWVVVIEALVVGTVGALLGLLLARILLAAAVEALAAAGYAFRPELGLGAARVAFAAVLASGAAGMMSARTVYRMDPVTALTATHRPWTDVISADRRRRLRRTGFIMFVFTLMFLSSAVHRPSPPGRLPDAASFELWRQLRRWDGDGSMPPDIVAQEGKTVEIEGYIWVPFDPAGGRAWRASFLLVAQDPNHPVELFHDDSEHRPDVNERIAVELAESVEDTRHLVRIRGTFRVARTRNPSGETLYHLTQAKAKVISLGGE